MNMDLKEAQQRIASQKDVVASIREEVGRVIVGQEKLVERLVLALITDGHILLEGVPVRPAIVVVNRRPAC